MADEAFTQSRSTDLLRHAEVSRVMPIAANDVRVPLMTPVIDWDRVTAFDLLAMCSVEPELDLALSVSRAIETSTEFVEHQALYVIEAPGQRAKIGIATCPARRFPNIQASNPDPLTIKALFWFYDSAKPVEQLALRNARSDGHGLRGEWVALDWFSAALYVAQAMSSLRPLAASSAMWVGSRYDLNKYGRGIRSALTRAHPEDYELTYAASNIARVASGTARPRGKA